MENLHAPTIPAGPTSTPTTNGTSSHLSFAELQQKKDNVEAELKALGGVLVSHGVDMSTPLLTRDGFPRSDLDVAQIRTTRARIIRLKNDYKEIMANAEKFLHEHFANAAESGESGTPTASTSTILPDSDTQSLEAPFAKVNAVSANSPAELSGLKAGDEIRNFGYVNWANHDGLKKVAECVQGNEGSNIFIRVSRTSGVASREELRLTLTPQRNWGGRGMLGCHITPM
ncbi:26S proteasome non-ATPase regulatory subunit 9, putative [Cordyceps militaris CM01]|uniref:Probable 26S proteasome regulatory subunit p27 n=1 Tax=Cordyceps militaris (strain CM01) TaxID=983644 RepID=G3JJ87_CORMM|nr:26S proteasome non-ATPase regulatory subunit 9, putative [Cordyceps militaris CM01]EGX92029.1 26S proteasome non-ATPase regulatory subunit 9, putative [Cordyceps militaris CM01]